MINKTEFELGYTPKNLRKLRNQYNLTKTKVAEITQTSSRNSVFNWELDSDNNYSQTMPHHKWLMLLKYLESLPSAHQDGEAE